MTYVLQADPPGTRGSAAIDLPPFSGSPGPRSATILPLIPQLRTVHVRRTWSGPFRESVSRVLAPSGYLLPDRLQSATVLACIVSILHECAVTTPDALELRDRHTQRRGERMGDGQDLRSNTSRRCSSFSARRLPFERRRISRDEAERRIPTSAPHSIGRPISRSEVPGSAIAFQRRAVSTSSVEWDSLASTTSAKPALSR